MKRCPQCQQTFSDENSYCLFDGTPLIFDAPEELTVIRPSPFVQQPLQPTRQGVSPMFAYLAIGLLALVVGGAVIFWIKSESNVSSTAKNEVPNIISNSIEPKSNKEQDRLSEQKTNLQEEQALLEKEKQKLADERKKLEARKNNPVETTFTSVSQPMARINFRKGSVQETISGSVASERSFVLRAKSGQYLSASVNSGNGCVVSGNGSTSINSTTIKGDNRLTLVNNCGGQTSFSLTVYIR